MTILMVRICVENENLHTVASKVQTTQWTESCSVKPGQWIYHQLIINKTTHHHHQLLMGATLPRAIQASKNCSCVWPPNWLLCVVVVVWGGRPSCHMGVYASERRMVGWSTYNTRALAATTSWTRVTDEYGNPAHMKCVRASGVVEASCHWTKLFVLKIKATAAAAAFTTTTLIPSETPVINIIIN